MSSSRTPTTIRQFSTSYAITVLGATCKTPLSTPQEEQPVAVKAAVRMVFAFGSPYSLEYLKIRDQTKDRKKPFRPIISAEISAETLSV